MQRIYKLKGVVQPYAWGGKEFIRDLTGITAGEDLPAAEYWLGTHPLAPSTVDVKGEPALPDLIRENKQFFLGDLSAAHESLPFLVKILDVWEMLSIQVHPTAQQAREGFESEEQRGIQLTAGNRNYKDANEKEEMMVALSDFWLLHGFRNEKEIQWFFDIPEFYFLKKFFDEGGYRALFTTVMEMEQAMVNTTLKPLAERVMLFEKRGELFEDDPDYWACGALKTYFSDGNIDRGIFCIYMLNLVSLKKGEAIYQPPGLLHAYLSGQNIEVMTNSDNVLRAGLTPKHIDVSELLKLVDFSPVDPKILTGETDSFETPSKNFKLWMYHSAPETILPAAPMILLVTGGELELRSGMEMKTLLRGEAALLVPGEAVHMSSRGNVEFFAVSAPKKES